MEKVSSLATANQKTKAKSLSVVVLSYLGGLFKRNPNQPSDLKTKLNSICWLFAKPKPADWTLPWCGNENLTYKAIDLFSDMYKYEVGCVRPLFKKCYESFITGSSLTFDSRIEQIRFLIDFFGSEQNDSIIVAGSGDSRRLLEIVFDRFYTFLVTVPKTQLNTIKKIMPPHWILNKEAAGSLHFASVDSCAFKVQNSTLPDLIQLNLSSFKYIFKELGVAERFSLSYLKQKITDLKVKFKETPLDVASQTYCSKIVQEMIDVDKSKGELFQLLSEDTPFYLPDETWILRDLKQLCSQNDTAFIQSNSSVDLYVLEESISPQIFGVKTAKQKIFGDLRIPFGQKEDLVDRLNNILERYATNLSVFKELIQNADDAGATELKFVLDTRSLSTNAQARVMPNRSIQMVSMHLHLY